MGAKTHHVSARRVGTLLLRAVLLASAADGSVRAQLTPGSIGQPDCRCVDASSALTPLINDWSVNNCMNHTGTPCILLCSDRGSGLAGEPGE